MKKLLALILCVMLFASVISTTAVAYDANSAITAASARAELDKALAAAIKSTKDKVTDAAKAYDTAVAKYKTAELDLQKRAVDKIYANYDASVDALITNTKNAYTKALNDLDTSLAKAEADWMKIWEKQVITVVS